MAIYDANALYGNTLRDLLIRLATTGLVRAKWTNEILDEMQRNLAANRPGISREKLNNLRALMISAVRDCLVEEYEPLVDTLKLPDPDDRHVLAAAIRAGARMIVTSNLKDFPPECHIHRSRHRRLPAPGRAGRAQRRRRPGRATAPGRTEGSQSPVEPLTV
ncbi:PIN domain-containing protein [Streptosporangium sp. NPDC048047]|uniref:PIN domain-containing protein n=1 Tax=Streptosporangium sp. NPDC048047 TaxID=3155748 RepID=UPI0034189D22